jgi:acyl CoA:acetate/3-ketoacid CoA transferase
MALFPDHQAGCRHHRATTADERGNLTFEDEGAYLGAMELALAAHNCGGKVIAQVKRIAAAGSLKPHDVRVPGILIDYIVEAPDQLQTTATPYDPRSRANSSDRSIHSGRRNSMSPRSSHAASPWNCNRAGR